MWHIQDPFTLSRKSWMQTSTYSKDSQPDANNLGCKYWTTIYFPSFSQASGLENDMEININTFHHILWIDWSLLITSSLLLKGFTLPNRRQHLHKKRITPCYANNIFFQNGFTKALNEGLHLFSGAFYPTVKESCHEHLIVTFALIYIVFVVK